MDKRAKEIIRVLLTSLVGSLFASALKIYYGHSTDSLAFVADGIHSLFDSAGTFVGIISIIISSRPPDEGHPYGHRKFETVSTLALALLLLSAAFEVGEMAYHRLSLRQIPHFSFWGFFLLGMVLAMNLFIARLEYKKAKHLSSHFLAADSLHNQSDVLITIAVLISLTSGYLEIPFVDPIASLAITVYLAYVSAKLILMNLKPLVDHRVLDPKMVEDIAKSTKGVLHCHHIRSRGEHGHHFLDLNLHLPGNITLEKAHEIAHEVEEKLKLAFPGLVDVVIHTEPHGHPPCSKDGP